MMDVLNRIDSLFEYFIHIDSISILCQAELLQSWWVTQQFQGCSQFLVQIWCGHSKSRQKAWDLSTFLFFGILSCEHKNCTDKNVNSGITCHYMSLLNYNTRFSFDSKLPICNSMILIVDHWCKHASAVHKSYSQNKCAIEANIIRFCMSIGQYEIFLNFLEIQEENMRILSPVRFFIPGHLLHSNHFETPSAACGWHSREYLNGIVEILLELAQGQIQPQNTN